jgi:hypothetical protein
LLVGLLSEWGCSKLDQRGVNMVKIERGGGAFAPIAHNWASPWLICEECYPFHVVLSAIKIKEEAEWMRMRY